MFSILFLLNFLANNLFIKLKVLITDYTNLINWPSGHFTKISITEAFENDFVTFKISLPVRISINNRIIIQN